MAPINLCIIKPNKQTVSETFVQEHINRLPGNKKVLYGGVFPVYDDKGKYLIKSKLGLLSYLIQKKIFKKQNIGVRTRALAKYLRVQKIDIVFAEYGNVGAMVTEACKIANVPLVVNFHGGDIYQKESYSKYIARYKIMFNYASSIVAVSRDMVDTLIAAGAPANKVYFNSCGVDTEKFKQLDISASKPYFLSVGRFVAKKSPQSVVKAFDLITRAVPEARLWMVGTGPLFDDTKALVKSLHLDDKITLTGALKPDKIIELFKQTRCFVQHSVTAPDGDMEGTPVTILEAGASGIPIISTLHAGIKQAVVDRKTGYLVPEHDIDAMASYMVKLAKDVQLATQLGNAGAIHIRENYDIKDRINTLTDILYKAIPNK